jgi:fibronectin-binding autotransporter adhesin
MKIRLLSHFRLIAAGLLFVLGTTMAVRAVVQMNASQTGPTFVVNTLADTNDGSCDLLGQGSGNHDCTLREAINAINAYGVGATITFSLDGMISVTSRLPSIQQSVTIDGTGHTITLDGGNSELIMWSSCNYRCQVNLNALTFAHSNGSEGAYSGSFNSDNTVTNCTFRDNFSFSGGAAIITNNNASVGVYNSTFFNNSGFGGGAIQVLGTNVVHHATIVNCTFSNNYARLADFPQNENLYASDIQGGSQLTVVVRNSIFVNSVNNHRHCVATLDTASSLADDGTCSATQVTSALVDLQPLNNNGGPTATMALGAGSVAIDAGDSSVSSAAPVSNLDQRGFARINPNDMGCDIGAFEYNAHHESLVVSTVVDENNGTSDPSVGNGTSLREAVIYAASWNARKTITFSPSLAGQTIALSAGWNDPNDDTALRISGGDLTIDGGDPANPMNLGIFPPGAQRRHLAAGGSGLLQLKNLRFQHGNLASNNFGGAAYLFGNAQLTNVRFVNNNAGYGGALFVTNLANVQVNNSLFQNNTATATDGVGGGLANGGGTLAVNDSTFTGNASYNGGALNSDGSLTVRRSTFSGNNSSFNGGALQLFGTVDIAESTISNNTATNGGGGLISFGNTTLSNVTIANNTAFDAGGAQFFQGTASLRYVTIAGNTATHDAGGTFINSADVTAIDTLVSGNTAPMNANLDGTAFNFASSNNLLNLSAAAALLGSLGNNGGPTQTIPLLPSSPAIDAGVAIADLTTDQRGAARSSAVDIGAFEVVVLVPTAVVSRKAHAGQPYDVSFALDGTSGVECRSGGATNDHTLVLTFANNVSVSGAPQAQVVGGSATIGSSGAGNGGAVTTAGNVVTVPLTSVANAQTVTIKLNSVSNGSVINDVTISVRFLVGDTNGNGAVNASDINLVKSKSGQTIDPTNFRNDVNANGSINAGDISLVKTRSGTALP